MRSGLAEFVVVEGVAANAPSSKAADAFADMAPMAQTKNAVTSAILNAELSRETERLDAFRSDRADMYPPQRDFLN